LSVAKSQGPDKTGGLIGLWGAELITEPVIGGELTIDARQNPWRATIGGYSVALETSKDTVTFHLPRGQGEFRGRVAMDLKKIRGHWIQPSGVNPYQQRYASPVELEQVSPKVWRGVVRPLEHRVSFYLSIQRADHGSLRAFIRNPEANYFSGRSYRVEWKGQSLIFSHPTVPEEGNYDVQGDRLIIPLLHSYPPLIFTHRKDKDAVGFFPRVQEKNQYTYQSPIAESDGWNTASLGEVGLDVRAIEVLVMKILNAVPSPENSLNIQSLLIARHGKLVLEEYFYGFEKNRTHDMRSASKTFAPVLVGIAHDHGFKIAANTPVWSLFPDYQPISNSDERKRRMKLEDLMNMASGLAIDDSDPSSPGEESHMQEQAEPDWCKYALNLPMVREPGGDHPVYGSANINLVGCAVRNATGKWLPELFDEYIARPLQISTYHMNLMPNGEAYAGGGLYLRARDQLKLGQLYFLGGIWNGKAIVDSQW